METQVQARIDSWLNGNYDDATKAQIKSLSENELIESFYTDLEFGTGGLRGIMGAGTNRMNRYTVARATQGFANYIKKNVMGDALSLSKRDVKVAVACDSRNNSQMFAEVCAAVFSQNGFTVYLFENLRPTPELSFAVRHLGCTAGVVLTASHNPAEYNGYKAYWTDGGQVVAPHDKGIIAEVNAITDLAAINQTPVKEKIKIISKEVDEPYFEMLTKLSVNPAAIARQADKLKIVYTPIHGAGITLTPEALKRFGFKNVVIVKEQEVPDGNFPTAPYPNPEEAAALKLGLETCRRENADLLLATDPDADRVGIAVKNPAGEFVLFNGNQTAALLINYLLSAWKEAGKIKGREFIVKTIVTTELVKSIAKSYGVESFDVLTGFKYIAEKIKELEGVKKFICGGEESYGYLVGDSVRDKDAVISCCIIAECAAVALDQGKSLWDVMMDIYIKHGLYREGLVSLTKKGKSGVEEIQNMMKTLSEKPPVEIAGSKVILVKDYTSQIEKDLLKGTSAAIKLPKANVLQFLTEDGTLVTARPSGTEPKIKFYFAVRSEMKTAADYNGALEKLAAKIESAKRDMGAA